MMSKSYVRGAVAAFALVASGVLAPMASAQSPAPAATAAPPAQLQPKPSPALEKTFKAAQEAAQAKRWPDVIAKAQEALGTSGRKPDDTYYAYALMFDAYRAQGNVAEAVKALEGQINSGFLPVPQQAPLLKAMTGIAFESKNYDSAITYGKRLIDGGSTDPDVYFYVGQAYYAKGDNAESARVLATLVDDQVKRGETPRENSLKVLHATNQKLGNRSAEMDALEKLVVYYPKPDYWYALLYTARNDPKMQSRQKLQVYRLMSATGTLRSEADFGRFAEFATLAGLPAEAQKAFEAGLAANAFTDEEKPRATRQMASVATKAQEEKAALPKLEADAKAAPTGDLDVVVGMQYYSYGDATKAVEALQRGVQKGGLKQDLALEGPLMLGIAQTRAKDNAGALKTFQAIKTDDPQWQSIIRAWSLYAR
jgi:hypothetical protein